MGIKQAKPDLLDEAAPNSSQNNKAEWRKVDWNNKDALLNHVKEYQPQDQHIKQIRILLHGPVGSGKSSFINSANSIFRGRMTHDAHVHQRSYTKQKQTHTIQKGNFYNFVFNDITGLEQTKHGIHDDDIELAMKGHVKDGYTFNPQAKMQQEINNPHYNREPTPEDKTHVLVCAIPADIAAVPPKVIDKIRNIRLAAKDLGIPQISILIKIDKADDLMEKDVKHFYKMKIVKEKPLPEALTPALACSWIEAQLCFLRDAVQLTATRRQQQHQQQRRKQNGTIRAASEGKGEQILVGELRQRTSQNFVLRGTFNDGFLVQVGLQKARGVMAGRKVAVPSTRYGQPGKLPLVRRQEGQLALMH